MLTYSSSPGRARYTLAQVAVMILFVPVEPEAGTARLMRALSSAVSVETEGIAVAITLVVFVVVAVIQHPRLIR